MSKFDVMDYFVDEKSSYFVPELIFEYHKKWLFGLIKIDVVVEDRKTPDEIRRYKHQFTVTVFGKEYCAVTRSDSIGHYRMDKICPEDKIGTFT